MSGNRSGELWSADSRTRCPGTKRSPAPQLAVIDLFSGVGGLSLGAARAGFTVRGAVESDPRATAAHRRNFPGTIHVKEDISKLTGVALKSAFGLRNGGPAGIIGGPPCQGFSCIGRNDKDDPRNRLFVHFFRLVSELRPKFFLAENVRGIMRERNAPLRSEAFSFVEDKYRVLPGMLLAAHEYGAPTTRARMFFFGCLPGELDQLGLEDFAPPPRAEVVRVRAALKGLPAKISPTWQSEEEGWRVVRTAGRGFYASRLRGRVPFGVGDVTALRRLRKGSRASGCLGTVHSAEVVRRFAEVMQGTRDSVSKSPRLDPEGFCPTIRAGTGPDRGRFQAVRPLHPTLNRVITPREAARLQGFPDWFQFSHTKWHSFRQIGNSVSPILAERILSVIRRAFGDGH